MFKNASIFKINLPEMMSTVLMRQVAEQRSFLPCGPSQERSIGWVSPRGDKDGELIEQTSNQHLILRLMVETKSVPSQALRDAVDEKVKQIEDATGRKPGKKERKELTEDTKLAMLPLAFANRSSTWVWIDIDAGLLVVDSASQARTDEVVTQIVHLIDGVTVQRLNTVMTPSNAMNAELLDSGFMGDVFSIGRSCELKAADESRAVVRYTRHTLDSEEIRQHISHGKMATKLALTYNDRVSFVLTEAGALTAIKFLDLAFEDQSSFPEDVFDTDVFLVTGELTPLISDLTAALGGEVVVEGGAL